MPSTSNNLHEPNLDDDKADPEQEFVFPPYDAGEDTPHDPTGLDGDTHNSLKKPSKHSKQQME
ncbi:hypothetical protein PCASD_23411 [Puccinia coronata f. sp. avenae]|uniref:Uncharacterized protein n=1 Tax=Puccinia coronata f. sp. avenae TaxID=200324 RepID=A0A2N5TQ02_9BASI|nr:hypothetical protein PCASD_23411 [Puccinia coronata f. sp. avenae]